MGSHGRARRIHSGAAWTPPLLQPHQVLEWHPEHISAWTSNALCQDLVYQNGCAALPLRRVLCCSCKYARASNGLGTQGPRPPGARSPGTPGSRDQGSCGFERGSTVCQGQPTAMAMAIAGLATAIIVLLIVLFPHRTYPHIQSPAANECCLNERVVVTFATIARQGVIVDTSRPLETETIFIEILPPCSGITKSTSSHCDQSFAMSEFKRLADLLARSKIGSCS